MSVEELQKYTAISKYARWLKEHKRREVWGETVGRYRDMMAGRFPARKDVIHDACAATERFEVLPSMRGMQFGGKPVLQHNGRLYNCTGSYCDRLRFFQEAFYLLLCGSGVGTSVQECHLKHLPKFSRKRRYAVKLPKKVFRPADTIEGWADCAGALLSSFHDEPVRGFEEYHDCEVEFDLSGIRPEGEELSFGVGVAPGPEPLRKAMERCHELLLNARALGLEKMDAVTAFDFFMFLADAVITGGVRRSATIVIFDLWNKAMAASKTGNWRAANPQRQRANISAMLLRGRVDEDAFRACFENAKQFGEPGTYWADHEDCLPNPCVEIGFWARLGLSPDDPDLARLLADYQGPVVRDRGEVCLSGWQGCNLTTINGKTVRDEADFYRRCEQAARLGTWQAAFTKFPYLGEVSERIFAKEALVGVSISGMMNRPDIFLRPEVLRAGAAAVLRTNEDEARLVGIRPAARATAIKPDGNSASLLGSFPGCSGGKFRRGFRIVQANVNEAPYKHFRSINPEACERCSGKENTDVVRFCLEYPGKLESEISAVDFLKNVRMIYENWIVPGKVEYRCTRPWTSNNVSNTVVVRDDEWEAVASYIFDNQHALAGNSVLSWYGDRDYAQAPFTGVFTLAEQVEMYGHDAVVAVGDLAEEGVLLFGNLWYASDVALGHQVNPFSLEAPHVWLENLGEFATRYFDGDVRQATYCLKDHFNFKLWLKLRAAYRPVDYAAMVEQSNGVKLSQEAACAGGACSLE